MFPITGPVAGNTYQVLLELVDNSNNILTSINQQQNIPSDLNAIQSNMQNLSYLYYSEDANPELKLRLSNFNFGLSFDSKLSVYSIILNAVKYYTS